MIHYSDSLHPICKILRVKGYRNFQVIGRNDGRTWKRYKDDCWMLRLNDGTMIDLGYTKPDAIKKAKELPVVKDIF